MAWNTVTTDTGYDDIPDRTRNKEKRRLSYSVGKPPDPLKGTQSALLAGAQMHIPQGVDGDLAKMAELSFRTAVKQQRAAKRLLNALDNRALFGPKAEGQRVCEPAILQLVFEMRDELARLEAIETENAEQAMTKSRQKITILASMAAAIQTAASEVAKITANTAKTAIESKKLLMLAEKNRARDEDDITDAELEA